MSEFEIDELDYESVLKDLEKDIEEKYQAIIEGKDLQIEAYKKEAEHMKKIALNLSKGIPSSLVTKSYKSNGFLIEHFINKDLARIHTKFIVGVHNLSWINGSPEKEKINDELAELIKEVLLISGIVQVYEIEKYSISFIKGTAFEWDEILPIVEEKLVAFNS